MTNQRSSRTRRSRTARTYDPASVKRRIIPARDATPITSLLFYARNKIGKTRLCSTATRLGKTLIIDCEEGTSSISKTDAEVYKLETWEEIDEIFWYLNTQNHGFKFICIDPISKLNGKCIQYVLRDKAAKDLVSDPYSPSQQDWGKCKELMVDMITKYKGLTKKGMFLIITAYERRRNNDDEDAEFEYVIGPDAQPAVKSYLMGHMDIIGRLYIKKLDSNEEEEDESTIKIERRMLFGPHEIYECGDRSDKLPRVMRQPTVKKILDLVRS